jgi:DNA-binding NtrC family response regulator
MKLYSNVPALPSRADELPELSLIGTSSVMRELGRVVRTVAGSKRPVLVSGPTGSGKEVVVQNIHALRPGRTAPLIDINCSAFSAALIESQLFGHERGAFTGAERRHDGFFTIVGEGTLFLDEIAEIPIDLQAKLLRVLETGTYRPIGSDSVLTFRGRLIAATHADLKARVRANRFREDLYYRLNVLEVCVPSLAERRSDIPELIAHFAASAERPLVFSEDVMRTLQSWPWPGNVRQLRNFVDRHAVLARNTTVTMDEIHALYSDRKEPATEPTCERGLMQEVARRVLHSPTRDKLRTLERALVEEALHMTRGNKTSAGQLLGVHRKVIERLAKESCDCASPSPSCAIHCPLRSD